MNFESKQNPNRAEISYTCQNFTDFDSQSRRLSGYNQRYQQLSCGKFQGHCTTMLLGGEFRMHYEILNQTLDQCAAVPNNHYLVILLLNDKGYCKINGQGFTSGNVFYAGSGSTVTGISGPETHSVVISLEKHFFETILSSFYPNLNHGLMIPEVGILENNRHNADNLRNTVRQLLQIMQADSATPKNTNSIKSLRQSVAEMIAGQIHQTFCLPTDKKRLNRSRRFQIVRHACDFIHQHQDSDLTITTLCRETGVSRRTLEYSFRDCVGQSPNTYLRAIKLNGIRRALLSPDNAHKSIGDIASEWGVWHLSRFAQYYRTQFHELPSQTRIQVMN
jgi:AraC family transcriptional regulator, ethanolamine operon transcriptional activator